MWPPVAGIIDSRHVPPIRLRVATDLGKFFKNNETRHSTALGCVCETQTTHQAFVSPDTEMQGLERTVRRTVICSQSES